MTACTLKEVCTAGNKINMLAMWSANHTYKDVPVWTA